MGSNNPVRVVSRDVRDILGEGPLWSPIHRALLWVDIFAPALRRLDLASGAVQSWEAPERIGWVVEREARDDLLVGLKSGFASLCLEPFGFERIGDPEPERPDNRLNDAKVDASGCLWAGTMSDKGSEKTGSLFRLDPDLRWSRLDEGYEITNGPTFSPDGRTLYHTDTAARTVFAFDLDPPGNLSNKRVFLRFETAWGYPDGMTTDAQGGIWIAHWGGARISRFLPDGRLDRVIPLPTSNITSMAFAGDGLDRMFVTSASLGCEGEAYAGALFEVDAGVVGLPTPRFKG
jgi:sugar lactone lactonase YvrE